MSAKKQQYYKEDINALKNTICVDHNINNTFFVLKKGKIRFELPSIDFNFYTLPSNSYFGYETFLKESIRPRIITDSDSVLSVYQVGKQGIDSLFKINPKAAVTIFSFLIYQIKETLIILNKFTQTKLKSLEILEKCKLIGTKYLENNSKLNFELTDKHIKQLVDENIDIHLFKIRHLNEPDYAYKVPKDIEKILDFTDSNLIDITARHHHLGTNLFKILINELGTIYTELNYQVNEAAENVEVLKGKQVNIFEEINSKLPIMAREKINWNEIKNYIDFVINTNPLLKKIQINLENPEQRLLLSENFSKVDLLLKKENEIKWGDFVSINDLQLMYDRINAVSSIVDEIDEAENENNKKLYLESQKEVNEIFKKLCIALMKEIYIVKSKESFKESSKVLFLFNFFILDKGKLSIADRSLLETYLFEFVKKADAFEESKKGYDEYQLYLVNQWVELVAKEKKELSVSEYSETFSDFLKRKKKDTDYQALKTEILINDDGTNDEDQFLSFLHMDFEVNNLFSMISVLNMEKHTMFPLYDTSKFPKSLETGFLTRKKVIDTLEEIKSIDYSVFYREISYTYEDDVNSMIFIEVLPDIIILPVISDKIMFWQLNSDKDKKMRSRLILPFIFLGNFRLSLLKALGGYRWELCKLTKDNDWMDPVYGGLTGKFYNFILFYKKNSKLSSNQKQKIETSLKTNRSNIKNIFVNYYVEWIEYESKGRSRFNKTLRSIMFEHIPFSRQYQKSLSKEQHFQATLNIHTNLTQKSLNILSNRLKKLKLETSGRPLPYELASYKKFLQESSVVQEQKKESDK